MIKSELVQRIAEHNPHLYQRDVENIVNAILEEIVAALARGDRVELRGFGAFSVKLPLFLLLIVVAALGVLAGGCAVWFGPRPWRRAARRHAADARAARGELPGRRAQGAAGRPEAQRLPVPSGVGLYGPIGRDKQ